MNKKGKSWPLFVVAILIVVFSLTAIFGASYQYGDTKNIYIKGASDIRFGIDIRGGVDVTFMPAGDVDATPEQMTAAKTVIEDRLVGIKSRELYEAPGAVALITAHQELENCCLEREQHRIKRDIDKRWGELVYDAQWFSPATQSLNAFIEDTQKYVSGEIRMVLHGGRAVVTGRRSDSSLYDYNLATYDSGDSFDQKSSNGFIDIHGPPHRARSMVCRAAWPQPATSSSATASRFRRTASSKHHPDSRCESS